MKHVKKGEKFKWPLWHFAVALVLSLLLTPILNGPWGLTVLWTRFCWAGYIVFGLLYFKGYLKTGGRIGWAVCLSVTLLMPLVAWIVLIAMFKREI